MAERPLLCPSAPNQVNVAQVFGVVGGTAQEPKVVYLQQPVPLTEVLADLPGGLAPDEVYRLMSPCQTKQCHHFTGTHCGLGERLKQELEPAVEALPPCSIRAACRWFQEQGRSICLACPAVVTRTFKLVVNSEGTVPQSKLHLRVV